MRENSLTLQPESLCFLQDSLHGIQRFVYCNSDTRACIRKFGDQPVFFFLKKNQRAGVSNSQHDFQKKH